MSAQNFFLRAQQSYLGAQYFYWALNESFARPTDFLRAQRVGGKVFRTGGCFFKPPGWKKPSPARHLPLWLNTDAAEPQASNAAGSRQSAGAAGKAPNDNL